VVVVIGLGCVICRAIHCGREVEKTWWVEVVLLLLLLLSHGGVEVQGCARLRNEVSLNARSLGQQ
jgi:hypothetical protein